MCNSTVFDRNLLSLSRQNRDLLSDISSCSFSPKVSFKTSRTGKIVPVLLRNNREYSLHSLFDPEKESSRYSASIIGGGYIVVFGLGAGYHIRGLLEREEINGVLIIDKDISILKSILYRIDLSDIFSDPRISILIDKSIDYILDFLPQNYLPAITGDFKTISLKSRIDSDKSYFSSVFESMKSVLSTLADDYTVQTWFGKKWFVNSIANLSAAGKSNAILSPQKKVSIAAAGPSLEIYLQELKKDSRDTFLISTDTALSCLLKHSIEPDLVISIDCQQISYHHFMAGYPKNIPLVLDLASPPILSRISDKTIFFTSGHPFSKYINKNWRKFPFVDTSGGNVTHAAISLAEKLYANEIYIYGADFSYPQGKSYARGTYIYPYFTSKSGRTTNMETQFYNFLYKKDNIKMVKTDYGFRYITRPMLSYKERLERISLFFNSNIIPVEGLGEKINIPPRKTDTKKENYTIFSAGKSNCTWVEFLNKFKTNLSKLNVPDTPTTNYFSCLSYQDRDIWTTLFPALAVIRKNKQDYNIKSSEILVEAKDWALEVIDMYLKLL